LSYVYRCKGSLPIGCFCNIIAVHRTITLSFDAAVKLGAQYAYKHAS
jgi:hypothetical protein